MTDNTWLPIEDAPKDAKVIFLGGWYFQGRWIWRLGRWNQYHETFNQWPSLHTGPFTHWMPLPEPPEPTAPKDIEQMRREFGE